MSIIPVTVPPKKLAQSISSSAMSFKLSDIKSWSGANLTPADFGTEGYGVFINSTKTQIEIFKFDPATIASASVTILARGLPYNGSDTPVPANQFAWAGNDTTVQIGTDAPQLFRDFLSEVNTATVTAVHTYNVLPESAVAPTTANQFVNKQYVDDQTGPSVGTQVSQAGHALIVGDVIKVTGINTYGKAQANTAPNAEVVGIVTEVIDANTFVYTVEGIITTGVPAVAAGTVLFLSPTTAGALTATEPTTLGHISMPLAIVTQSATSMVFHKYRGAQLNTIAGNPIASETVAGIVEQATDAQIASQTDVGETGAPLFVVPSKIPTTSLDTSYDALETINGATTPQAVTLDAAGRLILSDANAVGRQGFIGFATNDVTGPGGTPTVVGTPGTFASGSNSVTAPIGTDLTMFVIDYAGDNSSGAQLPSAMSYNGVPMTRVTSFTSHGNLKIGLWALPLGTLVAPLVANVVSTGGNGANYVRYSVVIVNNAKQTAPYVATSTGAASAASSLSVAVSPSQLTGLAIMAGASRIAIWNNSTAGVTDISTGANTEVSTLPITGGAGFTASGASSPLNADSGIVAFVVATATPVTQSIVRRLETLTGFTGLTVGADYFVTDTPGAISTTPGTARIRVGTALTTTKMLIHEVFTGSQFPNHTTIVFNGSFPTAFTSLNLSSVVGPRQRMVLLRCFNAGATCGLKFRRPGDTGDFSIGTSAVLGASNAFMNNASTTQYVIVATDANGVVEWTATSGGTSGTVSVEAYW